MGVNCVHNNMVASSIGVWLVSMGDVATVRTCVQLVNVLIKVPNKYSSDEFVRAFLVASV